jgi:uncharacterized damage-inducible protein DinB
VIERLRRWFEYDVWANREVLRGLTEAAAPPDKAVRLLAHIAGAELLWWSRLRGEAAAAPVWPEWKLEELAAQLQHAATAWRDYLGALSAADLEGEFEYVNSKGERHRSSREDVLIHVVMHSAYHRGQIAAAMRAAGFTPAYMDFIHATRLRLF